MKNVPKERSLAFRHPELLNEWDYEKNYPLVPENVTYSSSKMVWWKCKQNHEWKTRIDNRSNKHGCPYCSGHKVCKDNCLSTLNPQMAKEWHPTKNGTLTPNDVTRRSCKKVWWLCKDGHEWEQTIDSRGVTRSKGCEICHIPTKKLHEENCLIKKNPELAEEWNYEKNGELTPKDVFAGGRKTVWWKCKNGHEWKSPIYRRSVNRSGCPYCGKIELKDGTICDSLLEAYYYLCLKRKNIKFNYHVPIGLGRCSCDFYILSSNKYVEVTGYNKMWKYWKIYEKNILKKQYHITKKLKANFEFIQIKLLPDQIKYVRENSI